jgi:hypothetical protein
VREVPVPPAFYTVPEYTDTLGDEVAGLATEIGYAPDPEQRLMLDAMYALKPGSGNEWAAFEAVVICVRQNMKTGLFKMAGIADLWLFDDRLVVWTAHLFRTTQEAFLDIKLLIEMNPIMSRRVKKIYEGNGDESVELMSGARMNFLARSKTGGRGLTGAKVFLDEGFALSAGEIGSLYPTLATIPGAQIRIGSSAGLATSEILRGVRDRGRKGDPDLAYGEWCDDLPGGCLRTDCEHHRPGTPGFVEGCKLDDRRRWQRGNPQMNRRIPESRIASFRRSMPPAEFGREFMGYWDDPSGDSAIPAVKWAARYDADAQIAAGQVFALDVSPKMTYAAINVAGHSGDGIHTELLMREGEEELDYRPGTEWVVPALKDLKTRIPNLTVAIAANGQAKSLAPDLRAAGITVEEISGQDVASACGLLYKLADQGGLTHSGQPELAASVAAGQWRDTGEGAQVWGRRKSGEITGLYATTLAVWVAHRGIGLMHPVNNVW